MTPPYFNIFVIISLPFIWTNLNSLHPRIICTKFDWIWPAGSAEDFKKISVYFYSFAIISPWRGTIPFVWTNLNPFPLKDDLCQVWLKSAQWFRKIFLNEPPYFHIFVIRPYKIHYLVLRPIFPILDAGGRHFFFTIVRCTGMMRKVFFS
jgi:hypothetical protein